MPGARTPAWGFHRLSDRWARRLVAHADIRPGDLVLDLGAGTGAITAPLVAAGARVIAFELHPRRVAQLRERFADSNVKVVHADVEALRLPRSPFKVVANPPWGSLRSLLRTLLSDRSLLVRADLVVPAHVARRWIEGRGVGAGRWGRRFDVSVARGLPAEAFHPASPKPSVVLRFDRIRLADQRVGPRRR